MRLLLDTDAFCLFADMGLLELAAQAIGVGLEECGRLPALPHMLRRGQLRGRLGEARADRLLPIAMSLPDVPEPSPPWSDRLVAVHAIDPGEAQLFAVAAESDRLVLTGDARAVAAARTVDGLGAALRGKVVLPEVVLLRLCLLHGDERIASAVRGGQFTDKMLRVTFSTENPAPREALQSYIDADVHDLAPLVLWREPPGAPQ